MKLLKLQKGFVTQVDNENFEEINKVRWYAKKADGGWYVCRANQSGLLLHRHLMECPKGMVVDHINHDTLDNRRSNLRVCTTSQNGANRKNGINNTSGFKGVHWLKTHNKWRAIIRINGKQVYLGVFEDKNKAARAYNKSAVTYFGKNARLNKVI